MGLNKQSHSSHVETPVSLAIAQATTNLKMK